MPPSGFLPAETAAQILAAYGIAVPPAHQVHSPDEAGERAAEVGFPVVLKIISPDLVHKSDAGGVLLDLPDREAVREGYQELVAAVRRRRPEAQIAGVEVQRMVPEGQEVIVGALQDAQFGALVMFGSGGTEVEGLKDVEFSLAPLYPEEAERLLTATWAGRKLQGFRNLPPADRQAALEVLYRLGQLAFDFPQLAEIEINPLRVLPAGQGALALDARLRLAG